MIHLGIAHGDECVQLLIPITENFPALLAQPDFLKLSQTEAVMKQLMTLMDCLIGVMQGARPSTAELLFSAVYPSLTRTVDLLSVYENHFLVVDLILELLNEMAISMLCHLDRLQARLFYELAIRGIQLYAGHNLRTLVRDQTENEEESYKGVLLIIHLLTNILAKEIVCDFASAGKNDSFSNLIPSYPL